MFREKNIILNEVLPKNEDIFGLEKLSETELIKRFFDLAYKDGEEIFINGKKLPRDENGDFVDADEFAFYANDEKKDVDERRRQEAILDITDDDFHKKIAVLKRLKEIGSKKAVEAAVDFLGAEPDSMFYYQKEIMDLLKIDKNYAAEKILNNYENGQLLSSQAELVIIITTDLIGVEAVRTELNKRIENEQDSEKKYELEYAPAPKNPQTKKKNTLQTTHTL